MTTDELREKFENWWLRNGDPFDLHKVAAWETWQAAHASRDAEVEALRKDAERWRRARKLLLIADIEKLQHDFMAYGDRVYDKEGCVYVDEAIDAVMQEVKK